MKWTSKQEVLSLSPEESGKVGCSGFEKENGNFIPNVISTVN